MFRPHDANSPLGRLDAVIAPAIFLFVFIAHCLSPNAVSGDSRWVVPEILSLLSEGNVELSEFADLQRQHHWYSIDCLTPTHAVFVGDARGGCPPGSRAYSRYPVAPVLVAVVPFVIMDAVLRVAGPALQKAALPPVLAALVRNDYVHSYGVVEVLLASFVVAATAGVLYWMVRRFLTVPRAVLLTLLFAFATSAWSTASRAFWQHGPAMLMLACTLLLLTSRRASAYSWTAVPLVLEYFNRPTGVLAILAIGLYVLRVHPRLLGRWVAFGLVTALPFLAFHESVYHTLLPPYFKMSSFLSPAPQNVAPFASALAGQLLSPSRGLLTFTPFLLFGAYGICRAIRTAWQMPLTAYLAGLAVAHWLLISAFRDWTAGFSFGPRYFTDILPVLFFFLIPVVAQLDFKVRPILTGSFAATALLAMFIHARGAVSWDVQRWNDPVVTPARVWDWRDPQVLRGLH